MRSCCKVRSTVLCFWKFCRAFEGPHSASAIVDDVVLNEMEDRKWESEVVADQVPIPMRIRYRGIMGIPTFRCSLYSTKNKSSSKV